MPFIKRKRCAPPTPSPPPPSESSSSEDESDQVVGQKEANEDDTGKYFRCPWRKCRSSFKLASNMRYHYRTHTKEKPFICSYPSCNHPGFVSRSQVLAHICKQHDLSCKTKAEAYMMVQQEVLDEEAMLLGIRAVKKKRRCEEDDDGEEFTDYNTLLPHFDTIHRNAATNYLICPVSGCNKEVENMSNLKAHYRRHYGSNFRPYRCIFDPTSCQYAAKERSSIEIHILGVHLSKGLSNPNAATADRSECSPFIETLTDLLKMIDDLFNSAEVERRRKRSQLEHSACCSFPDCSKTSTQKGDIQQHVSHIHFNVPIRSQKDLISEEKPLVNQYVEVVVEDDLKQEIESD